MILYDLSSGLCRQMDADNLWMSENWRKRAQAVELCKRSCDVLSTCELAAPPLKLEFGVMAGKDWTVAEVRSDGAEARDALLPMVPEGRKRCTWCSRVKSVAAFPKHALKKDGLSPHCRDCVRVKQADRRSRKKSGEVA